MTVHTFTVTLDEDDYRAVQAAIAERQRCPRWDDDEGGVLLPEGKSDLRGALLAEICRAFVDYRNTQPNEMED